MEARLQLGGLEALRPQRELDQPRAPREVRRATWPTVWSP